MGSTTSRIKKLIERERLKTPGIPALLLLIRGIWKGLYIRAQHHFMHLRKDSTFTSEEHLFMCSLFPKKVLDIILETEQPRSVLDVGCGTGTSLAYFLQKGVQAQGVENAAVAIRQSPVKQYITKYNLNKTYRSNRRYDLVWCFEVIEHIHPDYEANFLQTLVLHADTIIVSAARPGQGGHGHFNEQEPGYWINRFDALGYDCDHPFSDILRKTGEVHAENLLCFRKRTA